MAVRPFPYLMLFPQQPLLDREEAGLSDRAGAVERGRRAALLLRRGGLRRHARLVGSAAAPAEVARVALGVVFVRDGRSQTHAIVIGNLKTLNNG